ncbi:MAG: sigma factor-like helix-turn-helix DNA-binding protein [Paracoccaceae bacterium]
MTRADDADLLWHTAFGVAYRILGLPWQAEDVAQSTLERWVSEDRAVVRMPEAFVARTAANLALNLIRSEKRIALKHEAFGLPLPVIDDDSVETRLDLSYAISASVMQLPPFMRAVFVLRSAFDMGFDDIAMALEKSPAACRQSFSRARRKLAKIEFNGRSADQNTLAKLVSRIEQGDEAGLIALMAHDIALESDGGTSAPAFGKIVDGRDRLAKFLVVSPAIFGDGLVPVFGQSRSGDFVLLKQKGHIRLVVLASSSKEGINRLFALSDPEKLECLYHAPKQPMRDRFI